MMTTTDPAALLAARAAAQRLNVQQKAQLISELVNEIAQVAVPAVAAPTGESDSDDVLAELDQLISEAAEAGPPLADSADVLAEIRR